MHLDLFLRFVFSGLNSCKSCLLHIFTQLLHVVGLLNRRHHLVLLTSTIKMTQLLCTSKI